MMVFSSLSFLFLFLPAFLLVYFGARRARARNAILVASSLVFYGWTSPYWIIFLLTSAIFDYGNGLWIEHHRDSRLKMLGVVSTLVVNLGLLIVFKYWKFIGDAVASMLHARYTLAKPELPVGMSFYTFETISYTLDVYRGKVTAQRSLLRFLVFICSFPRLVAGPIVRYGQVSEELGARPARAAEINEGATRFIRGLFKKVFFANAAGELTSRFLDASYPDMTVLGSWFGLIMFTLQIYYDFSGYSDMAIGLGHIVGFQLPENFRHPYVATSITDFWRRWHISMSSFFRDYVYIPLGGNRTRQVRNILITWAATGLWHGASWNFVLWGMYFAVLLIVEKYALLGALRRAPTWVGHVYALFFIVLGWLIFHVTDLHRLGEVADLMFGHAGAPLANYQLTSALRENACWILLAVLFCAPLRLWLISKQPALLLTTRRHIVEAPLSLGMLLTSVALLVGSSYNPFIYYQF